MSVVRKYTKPKKEVFSLKIPLAAKILRVDGTQEELQIWVLEEESKISKIIYFFLNNVYSNLENYSLGTNLLEQHPLERI